MPLARKLTGGAALVLLSLLPSHQRVDDLIETGEVKSDAVVLVSRDRDQYRMQASLLAQPIDEAQLKQKKSLSKAISTLRGGDELGIGQSFKLVSNFKSFKAAEMVLFLTQVQRDVNNPESSLHKKLNPQSRAHLTQHMTPFLKSLLDRADQNDGKIKFICADLPVLQKFNELPPAQKAILLGEFKEHAFPSSIPSRDNLIAFK